ncbi:FK506-binding protein 1B [Beauveria bassiana]|uniref:peptidylprolyl isomerase n=1 Tax=Beauveria bassiana TaxID=176275 RepID=A0A2N6P1H2_BEABA|nr:FK506-binding protein 1B [Beauveria bassiana]
MGVTKTIIKEGSGEKPKPGQTVVIEYTGWLKDASKSDKKGNKFDSSVGRGDFEVKIGVGQVIRGWDEGVTQMRVGEKATLDISRLNSPGTDSMPSDFGYGARGFPGHIPANADLMFDVELKDLK